MSLGAEFDDEIFDRLKENILASKRDHGSSTCIHEWLLDPDAMPSIEKENLECLKNKADYQYFQKNYTEASELYEKCLRLIPASSTICRRNCTEYLLCSLLNMGSADKALEWALKMDASASTADEKIQSLNLLARVCHELGRHEEELEALHTCLASHDGNPDLWFRIACCYGGLFKIPLPNSSHKRIENPLCCEFKARLSPSVCSSLERECHSSRCDCIATSKMKSLVINDDVTDCHSNERCNGKVSPLPESPEVSNGSSQTLIEKCEFCTLGVQMIAACLMKAKLLLDSEDIALDVEKSTKVKDKVNNCLMHMEVEQSFIDEASKMLTLANLPSTKLESEP